MDVSDIINKIYRLPQTSLDTLIGSVSEVEYPKNFHLHRENKKETKSYFIKKGIVRAYTHKDDKEVTFWFGQEGDLVLPLQTLSAGLGEYATVELLEDCILYEIALERLQELYLNDIHIANWGRKFAESEFLQTEERLISLLFTTASERYMKLIQNNPELLQRMPLECLASYLGITPVSLSRIRAKLKRVL